jgi:hypothetical protein
MFLNVKYSSEHIGLLFAFTRVSYSVVFRIFFSSEIFRHKRTKRWAENHSKRFLTSRTPSISFTQHSYSFPAPSDRIIIALSSHSSFISVALAMRLAHTVSEVEGKARSETASEAGRPTSRSDQASEIVHFQARQSRKECERACDGSESCDASEYCCQSQGASRHCENLCFLRFASLCATHDPLHALHVRRATLHVFRAYTV